MNRRPDEDAALPAQDAREWVDAPVSERQVDEAWNRLRTSSGEARRVPTWGRVVIGAAAAAAVLVAVGTFSQVDDATESTRLVDLASSSEPLSATLPEGSSLHLAPGSRVHQLSSAPSEMAFSLDEGSVDFDVAPRPERHFVVWTEGVRVRVLGTRFTVARELENGRAVAVEVSVLRGRVEVTPPSGESSVLFRGHSRRIILEPEPSIPEPASGARAVPPPPSAPEDRPRPRRRATPEIAPPSDPTASELWAQARDAEAAGDVRTALEGYEALFGAHPRDGRASLAAFEAGRLRMDHLHDPRGASLAFRRALALAPRSPLGDEALARLVRIYDTLGDVTECRTLRDRYLETMPEGRHRPDVESRCH